MCEQGSIDVATRPDAKSRPGICGPYIEPASLRSDWNFVVRPRARAGARSLCAVGTHSWRLGTELSLVIMMAVDHAWRTIAALPSA